MSWNDEATNGTAVSIHETTSRPSLCKDDNTRDLRDPARVDGTRMSCPSLLLSRISFGPHRNRNQIVLCCECRNEGKPFSVGKITDLCTRQGKPKLNKWCSLYGEDLMKRQSMDAVAHILQSMARPEPSWCVDFINRIRSQNFGSSCFKSTRCPRWISSDRECLSKSTKYVA